MKAFLLVAGFGVLMSAAVFAGLLGCSRPPTTASLQENKTATPVLEVKKVETNRITLEGLEQLFEKMRSNMNTEAELLWGYFFTDPDPKKLERLVDPLTRAGYRFGSIYPTDDGRTHFLHVEKIEKHTPQTLHARNTELYRLADEYGLESYDGMDVGPVPSK